MNKKILGIICSLIITGCATKETFNYDEAIKNDLEKLKTVQTENISSNYLTDLFNNNDLDLLIKESILKNPSVQSSLLSIQISELQVKETLGNSLPTADFNLTGDKKEGSDQNYSSDISVSWELDIWGKISDAEKIAKYSLEAQDYEHQNVIDILAANVIRNWIEITTFNNYIEIEENRLLSLEKSEKFVLQRYRKGLGDLTDLDNIRQNIYTTKSTIAGYKNDLNESYRSLSVLTGDVELKQDVNITKDFVEIFSPLSNLGIQDLSRRPDLKSAYLDIVNQDLTTSIAYKNMLPSLSLSVSFEDSSDNLVDSLFVSPLWSVLGNITMPLFNSGSLEAAADIESLRTEKVYWDYQQTLLEAVKEVEDYKNLELTLSEQQGYLENALNLSIGNEKLDKERYLKGLIQISDYLDTQRDVFDLEKQVIDTVQSRITNRINLGLSLGLGVKK